MRRRHGGVRSSPSQSHATAGEQLGGSREHPPLQSGKGGPGSEPRSQLDGAQAGWWRGPHGALWLGSQLPQHLPWRRRGGRGLGANSTLSFQ